MEARNPLVEYTDWQLQGKHYVRRYSVLDPSDRRFIMSILVRYEHARHPNGSFVPIMSFILHPWSVHPWQVNPRISLVREGRPPNPTPAMVADIKPQNSTAFGVNELEVAEEMVSALRTTQDLEFRIIIDPPSGGEGIMALTTLPNDMAFRELHDRLCAGKTKQGWFSRLFRS